MMVRLQAQGHLLAVVTWAWSRTIIIEVNISPPLCLYHLVLEIFGVPKIQVLSGLSCAIQASQRCPLPECAYATFLYRGWAAKQCLRVAKLIVLRDLCHAIGAGQMPLPDFAYAASLHRG